MASLFEGSVQRWFQRAEETFCSNQRRRGSKQEPCPILFRVPVTYTSCGFAASKEGRYFLLVFNDFASTLHPDAADPLAGARHKLDPEISHFWVVPNVLVLEVFSLTNRANSPTFNKG